MESLKGLAAMAKRRVQPVETFILLSGVKKLVRRTNKSTKQSVAPYQGTVISHVLPRVTSRTVATLLHSKENRTKMRCVDDLKGYLPLRRVVNLPIKPSVDVGDEINLVATWKGRVHETKCSPQLHITHTL